MEIIPTKEILKSLCNDVEAASRQAILPTLTKVRFDACPTGFNDLDRLIGGISPGYIVIAGRPCHGAGELFRNTLINAILNFNLINNFSHKQKALIFSTSLSSQDFMSRVLCAFGLVSLNNLLKAQMNDNESAQFSKVVSFFAEQQDPFLIVDNMTPLFVEDLDEFILKTIDNYGHLPIIAFDSLQAIRSRKPCDSRYAETAEVSRTLKELQIRYNTRIIVGCSVNRAVEQRADMRPVLSDLRDSGTIEDDANLVLFTYVKPLYDDRLEEQKYSSLMEVLIGKNDWGQQGRVELLYRHDKCSLCNYLPDAPINLVD